MHPCMPDMPILFAQEFLPFYSGTFSSLLDRLSSRQPSGALQSCLSPGICCMATVLRNPACTVPTTTPSHVDSPAQPGDLSSGMLGCVLASRAAVCIHLQVHGGPLLFLWSLADTRVLDSQVRLSSLCPLCIISSRNKGLTLGRGSRQAVLDTSFKLLDKDASM